MKKNIIEEQSINDNNYQKLKELFPHAVSVDEDGKYIIDKEKLQMSLDPSKAEIKEDGYGLNWVGKKEAYHSAFSKNYKVLKPLKEDSKNWDETENILIKGDNLDALKILRHNYFESIKMIYIDPPYNTKNDGFVYNDNFTSSTEQTLEELGYDREYIDYIENIQGAKTHSGWLSFMYPRLLLARDLLKDDGVIFISIDDNEVAQLRLLCDEVFGEENFVGEIIIQTATDNNKTQVNIEHEYMLTYAKNKTMQTNWLRKSEAAKKIEQQYLKLKNKNFPIDKIQEELRKWIKKNQEYLKQNKVLHYDNVDNKGVYHDGDIANTKFGGYKYNVVHPITQKICKIPEKGFRYPEATLKEMIENNDILFGKDETVLMKPKRRLETVTDSLRSIIYEDGRASSNVVDELVGRSVFQNPKSNTILSRLIDFITNQNDLILDFFAGSGTTAHAVMDLNAKDGGNRKYICVQWAEETPLKSEARKAGYETIFDITKARIDRAGEKIMGATKVAHPKDQTLFGESEVSHAVDIGFRTFEVVEDTKQKIYQKSLEEMSQEDLLAFTDNKTIESNEEILYNLFVAEALPLSAKHTELIKEKLYLANNVAFILGDITSDELVEALKEKKECEYITVYSPNISNDKFTLEIESNISKLGIKPDKLRFRG
jgi:adenine-specific DNA-methyltransferase